MGWLNKVLSFIKSIFKAVGNMVILIVNSILLGFVYFIGVGITSIIAKIFGKHFLDIKPSKKESYWLELRERKRKSDFYRQF